MTYCPDCDRELFGKPACACGWKSKVEAKPTEYVPRPAPVMAAPVPGLMDGIKKLAAKQKSWPYWTTDVVKTDAQVRHIVRQALHCGAASKAGRFLQSCIDSGVITRDHKLGRVLR